VVDESENLAPRRGRKRQLFVENRPVAKPVQEINGHDIEGAATVLPPYFTEDEIALRFSQSFAPSLRYIAAWGKWMLWDGKIWRKDDTLRAFDLVRRHCRVLSAEATDPKVKMALTSARMVAGIEKLVRADRMQATTADQWDGNPWLLNTPGGVIDLKTGGLMPHKPSYQMTKTTAIAPDWEMLCPQWLAFLDKVTGNNLQLVGYLKRFFGYCLTGLTTEHAMAFLFGTGRNGKGVFLNTVSRILGDYAMTASPDTFTESGSGKHLTVLARLMGARLVVSQETEEGVPWAEARIKAVTGGDPITANFMRQDPFTYLPQFKLTVAGNHKPELKSVDEAIRGRFNLVPFTVTIPPSERDPGLSEKLWQEAPAILAWLVEGCLDWQAVGLKPPSAVTIATNEYFESEDAITIWIRECCVIDNDKSALSSTLYNSWSIWSVRQGQRPGSHKAFSRNLERLGYEKKREGPGMYVLGIIAVVFDQ
jgi:putative DNA primase/helicase